MSTADDLLKQVADIAHAGGLTSQTERTALYHIRLLTLEHFKLRRSQEQLRDDVAKAVASARSNLTHLPEHK